MHNFTYLANTKLIFGKGTIPNIIPELKADGVTNILLLTGSNSVYKSGLYDKIVNLLNQAGITHTTLKGVQPNPRLSLARQGVKLAVQVKAQAIMPIGGGSVFDTAKAVALGACSQHDIWELMLKHKPTKALPIYGILTLSGTSSEGNGLFVITNDDTRDNFTFSSEHAIPKVALVDPELQFTVPLSTVIPSGLDAMIHVLEAYFEGLDTSPVIVEHCEAYARSIMRCLSSLRGLHNFNTLPNGLNNYDLRAELAFCSVYAHSGWASVGRKVRGDFSSHKIGHAISGLFDVTHGVTLGIIMPAWMRYVYDLGLGREIFARFASQILGLAETPGGDQALAGVEGFKDFVASLGLPTSLREVGIKEADIPKLAEYASHALPFGCVKAMDLQGITTVLKLAL